MKRLQDQDESYEGKHLIGAAFQFHYHDDRECGSRHPDVVLEKGLGALHLNL